MIQVVGVKIRWMVPRFPYLYFFYDIIICPSVARSKSKGLKYRILITEVHFICGDVKLVNKKSVQKNKKWKRKKKFIKQPLN